MDALRRLPILERTAKILLMFSYSTNQDSILPIKQEELANTLGVSRVTMGKTLKKLAATNLISLGYGAININSKSALIEWLLNRNTGTAL